MSKSYTDEDIARIVQICNDFLHNKKLIDTTTVREICEYVVHSVQEKAHTEEVAHLIHTEISSLRKELSPSEQEKRNNWRRKMAMHFFASVKSADIKRAIDCANEMLELLEDQEFLEQRKE